MSKETFLAALALLGPNGENLVTDPNDYCTDHSGAMVKLESATRFCILAAINRAAVNRERDRDRNFALATEVAHTLFYHNRRCDLTRDYVTKALADHGFPAAKAILTRCAEECEV